MYGLPLPYWLTLAAAALTVFAVAGATLDRRCPFCARRWAFYRRGRDHVCRVCARDIDRRIRAAADDPPVHPRPRILK